jgi:hypothetical protein
VGLDAFAGHELRLGLVEVARADHVEEQLAHLQGTIRATWAAVDHPRPQALRSIPVQNARSPVAVRTATRTS